MLLQRKNAVVYGGGGAIGGAVARAFAREGAKVFLAGRTLAKLERVSREISAAGGRAEIRSSPGEGTTIRLSWPASTPGSDR